MAETVAATKNSPVDEQRKRPWTVMIFMVAERVPEWADLSKVADKTLRQIKCIAGAESQDWLRIRIQLHSSKGVTRHASGPTGLQEITDLVAVSEPGESETDLTNGLALEAFLKWALRTAKHKGDDTGSDNSLLVMWGHAYPFGIGFRDTGTGVDALDFSELSTVLNRIQGDVIGKFQYKDPRLDILGFDACDLATIELARHFSPYAKYLVASQMPIPLPGWPYRKILGHLSASHTGVPMTPENLGSYIVRKFCGSYQGKEDAVSLSLLSLAASEGRLRPNRRTRKATDPGARWRQRRDRQGRQAFSICPRRTAISPSWMPRISARTWFASATTRACGLRPAIWEIF